MAAVSTIVRLQTSGDLSRPGLGDEDDIRQNVRLCMCMECMGSVSRAGSMATGKSWLPHDDPMDGITRPRSRKAIPALTCPHTVYHKCRASLRPLRPIRTGTGGYLELIASSQTITPYSRGESRTVAVDDLTCPSPKIRTVPLITSLGNIIHYMTSIAISSLNRPHRDCDCLSPQITAKKEKPALGHHSPESCRAFLSFLSFPFGKCAVSLAFRLPRSTRQLVSFVISFAF